MFRLDYREFLCSLRKKPQRREGHRTVEPRRRWFALLGKSLPGVALCAWSSFAAAASNNHTFKCTDGYSGYVCKAGNNSTVPCTNSTANPTDLLNITNVSAGSVINFSFTDAGNIPTSAQVTGQGNTAFGPSSVTVPPSPQTLSYTVTATDAADGQSDFKVDLLTNSPGKTETAAATYTVSCTAPPSSRTLILQKVLTNSSSVALPSGTSFSLTAGGQAASATTSATIAAGAANQSVPVSSGTITTLTAGSYTVAEGLPAAPAGTQWSAPAFACSVTTAGTGTSASGANVTFGSTGTPVVTCTVTNTLVNAAPQQGTINLIKTTKGPNGFTLTSASTFTLVLAPSGGGSVTQAIAVTGFNTSSPAPQTLSAGTYTFGEGALPPAPSGAPAGSTWQNTSLSCAVSNSAGSTSVDGSGKVVTLGAGGVVNCRATNTLNVPFLKGSITIIKQVTGGTSSDIFTFTAPDGTHTLQSGGSFTVSNLSAPGPYTITEQPNAAFFAPQISCTASNAAWTAQSANRSVQVTFNQVFAGTLSATCTFFNKKEKDDPAKDITTLYIHRNLDNLLSNDPDRARILRRLDGTPEPGLKDGGSYGDAGGSSVPGGLKDPVRSELGRLQGRSDIANAAGMSDIKVSASLSQMQADAAAREREKLTEAGLVYNPPYGYNVAVLQPRLDVWVEGHIAKYTDGLGGIDREGNFSILYAGGDYVIRPGLLVGALVQFDRTSENIKNPDIWGRIQGGGWMAGPYMGAKLSDHLYFDARAAWGQSSNDLSLQDNVVGSRTGTFNTERWLTTAALTGNYHFGAFRVSPQLELAWGGQAADAYRTSLGQIVDKTNVTIGRLSFGPEFGYAVMMNNGIVIEPQFSVKGIWGFDDGPLDLSIGIVRPGEFRGQVEGGLMAKMPDGFAVRASGTYDGIGDKNLEVWTAKVWLNFPLN